MQLYNNDNFTSLIKHNLRCVPLLARKEEPKCDASLSSAGLDLLLESLFYKVLARIILNSPEGNKIFCQCQFL